MEILQRRMVGKRLFDIEPSQKVCRKLFGDVDHDEIKRDLARDYRNILKQKCLMWNFDFEKGVPQQNKGSSLTWLPLKSDYQSLTHDKKLFLASTESNKTTDVNQISSKNDSSTDSQRINSLKTDNRLQTSAKLKLSATANDSQEKTEALSSGDTLKKQYKKQEDIEIDSVKIMNESPTRPTFTSPDIEITKVVKRSIKCNTDPLPNNKRKLRYQQKIDEFMKKRKRRISFDALELSSCKSYNKDTSPVSTRLRSSQVTV